MNWTQLLKAEADSTFATTLKLLEMVDPEQLDWKPATGSNWMTMGQLLKHIATACGAACKAFATGDWGLPPGTKMEDMSPEQMLPPAEKFPTVASLDEAKAALTDDWKLTLQMIADTNELAFQGRQLAAPWAPGVNASLGHWFLRMIQHLDRHKSQLFYYLKLQGKTVSTPDLWGT